MCSFFYLHFLNSIQLIYYSKVSYSILITVFVLFFTPFLFDIRINYLNYEIIEISMNLLIIYVFILNMYYNTTYTTDNERDCIFNVASLDINLLYQGYKKSISIN